jgi:3'-5' exoribonuclease
MHKKIDRVLRYIDDSSLREVIENIMSLHHNTFIYEPAGCGTHHAYKGGLLDHSVSTALLAESIADRYVESNQRLNKSLIVAGAFLHDIGKVKCYTYDKSAEEFRSTQKSRLHHHIPIGFHIVATQVEILVDRYKMDEALADNLLHIIVSHHGRVEYSSPRAPITDEAFIVSQADLIDAYMGAPLDRKKTFNQSQARES